jgi:cation diffusion facilitator family transporter
METHLLDQVERGLRAARAGLLINVGLVIVKLGAGAFGRSYALIADGVESSLDVVSSLVVWGGLRITARPADEDYPYGYGKAETLATVIVALLLVGAAAGIAVAAIREIRAPQHMPAPFTLAVVPLVVVVKEGLFRRVRRVGHETGSSAVQADAWHHRSDAITSAAAFVGIAVALWGGPGWEAADDWAALVAAAIIATNGVRLLRPTLDDLMDRMPAGPIVERIDAAARGVAGVRATEKLRVRKLGTTYYVDIHVQADPRMSLVDAHILSGKVKSAIHEAVPSVAGVLVHMEPFEGDEPPAPEEEDPMNRAATVRERG